MGGIVGIIGANALEHKHKRDKEKKEWEKQQEQYYGGRRDY